MYLKVLRKFHNGSRLIKLEDLCTAVTSLCLAIVKHNNLSGKLEIVT